MDKDTIGYTWQEMVDISKRMCAEYRLSGKIPIKGSGVAEYMIIGDMMVYKPYIPLYVTGGIK